MHSLTVVALKFDKQKNPSAWLDRRGLSLFRQHANASCGHDELPGRETRMNHP